MGKTFKHNVWQAVRANREVTHPKERELMEALVDPNSVTLANGSKNCKGMNRYGNNRKKWAQEKRAQRRAEKRGKFSPFSRDEGDEGEGSA